MTAFARTDLFTTASAVTPDHRKDPRDARMTDPDARDLPIVEKIRRGRLAALAALRARTADARNVVSIFDTGLEPRVSEPVFHSIRQGAPQRPSRLLLTTRVPA